MGTTHLPPNRLRELREAKGVRPARVAVLCDVDQATVRRWEIGVIPQQHLPALADLLDVDVPYLAGWTDRVAETAA